MREQVIKSILENKIIAIVRGVEPEKAINVAKALSRGGIKLIEVTFNQKATDNFKATTDAISAIKENCPNVLVGAGTVLTKQQVDLAILAGAKYIISPDTDEEIIRYSVRKGLVSLPGAYTASEAKKAYSYGADFVKLFPCMDVEYLKALKAPLSHIKFLAVGGINLENASTYIKAGAVGVGVGSSLVNKKFVEEENWEALTDLAKQFIEKVGL